MSYSYRRLALLLCMAAPLSAIEFSTFIGNASADFQVARVVSDAAGDTYIAGNRVFNSQLLNQVPVSTMFVMKLDPTGQTVLYATFGGTGTDTVSDLAVDASGNIYVAGSTSSPVFPIHNALQSAPGPGFLVKLNPDATGFIWSTYFPEPIYALAVDASGNVYVVGTTSSSSFPATPGISYGQVTSGVPSAVGGAFLTKISAAGDCIVYSSGIAGSLKPCGGGSSCFLSNRNTIASAVAVDPAGNAYTAGNTDTIDLPTTPGALMPSGLGAFAMKINAAGTAIAWLTYNIGSGSYSTITPFIISENTATAIAADAAGNAYVVGSTIDPTFPATAGAYQTALGSLPPGNPPQTPTDGFVVKLNGSGGALWATYLGGQGADVANSVAVDSSGDAWVSGTTASANFPNAQGWSTGGDFVVGFNPTGSALAYAARYPTGSVAQSMATDPGGFLHLAGSDGLISTLLPGQPTARVFGVANTAFGGLGGIVAPAEVISIYGPGIGPAVPVSPAPGASGMFPKSLGGVQVLIGGASAPLLYVSASRIDAVVPSYLPGSSAAVQVTVNNAALPVFTASIAQTDPQVFQNADGSAAAINQDNTINSAANPAQPGSIISIWATGTGAAGSIPDGQVATAAQDYSCCFVVSDTSVSEATPAATYYAGAAPGLVKGITQINFQVPPSGSAFRLGAGEGISGIVTIYVASAAP